MRHFVLLSIAIFFSLWGIAVPSEAVSFTPFSLPGDDNYLGLTSLFPIVGNDFTDITTLSGPAGTIQLSLASQVRTVSDSWNTWNTPPFTATSTPRVLFSNNSNSLTLSFSDPLRIFGFEAEPENLGVSTIMVNFFQELILVGTISQDVDGDSGALLFAAATDGSFTGVTITVPNDTGFGMAEIRGVAIPEPSSYSLLAVGLAVGALAMIGFRRWGTAGIRSTRQQA